MKIEGKDGRALWFEDGAIQFIDQRKLPYKLEYYTAKAVDECAFAIKDMVVRGAPAIGAAAVYGMVLGKDNIKKMYLAILGNDSALRIQEDGCVEQLLPILLNKTSHEDVAF